jgi:hypothetical protein
LQLNSEDVPWIIAKFHMRHSEKGTQQQAGASQKHKGERNLRYD